MRSIFVCGSGRSGTSMLAGLFSECGYFQGEDLYPSREANPKGFFENWQINFLNERIILSSLEAKYGPDASGMFQTFYRKGQYWLARLPVDLPCVATTDDKKEISDLVAREPFCYKDPRFCFTLEPWLGAARNALALCVFRHPGVVVASILKELQNAEYLSDLRISISDLYETWRHMYLRMLSMRARGHEVYFVNYNDLFKKTKLAEIEKHVGAKLNRLFPDKLLDRSGYGGDLDEATKDLFDALNDLASQHFTGQPVKTSAALFKRFSTKSGLHHIPIDVAHPAALKADRPTVGKGDSGGPVFSESELQGFVYRLYEQQKNLEAGIEHKESELYKAHAKLAQGDKQIASLRADIGLQTGRIADLEAKQQQLMGDYSGLQIIAAEQKGAIVTFETVLTQRTVELEGLRSDISSRDARIGALETTVTQRTAELEGLRSDISSRDARIGALETTVTQRTAELEGLRSDISSRNARIGALETTVTQRTAELEGLRSDISSRDARIGALETTVTQRTAELEGLRSDISSRDARIGALETTVTQRTAELEGLRSDISSRDARIGALETTVTQRTAELEGLRSDISSRDARIGALESMLVQRDQRTVMLVKEIDQCNHEISTLKGSLSWRVTAPLRAIKRWWLNIVHA